MEDDPLLDETEAAAYLGVKPRLMRDWRHSKSFRIDYIKFGALGGRGAVRYRKSALDEAIQRASVIAE